MHRTPLNFHRHYRTSKSRGCGGGHKQVAGEDYGDSYAPTTRVSNVRVILSTAEEDHLSEQADIEGAFLYPMLEGKWRSGVYYPNYEIYMKPFEGFEIYDENGELMILLLLKARYGLVQAALLWNRTLVDFFNKYKFRQCTTDPCVFVQDHLEDGQYLSVPVHVDDMIPTGKPQSVIDTFLDNLAGEFSINRLGPTEWFSGILIKRKPGHVYMMQPHYSEELLRKWKMDDPALVPMKHGEDICMR